MLNNVKKRLLTNNFLKKVSIICTISLDLGKTIHGQNFFVIKSSYCKNIHNYWDYEEI